MHRIKYGLVILLLLGLGADVQARQVRVHRTAQLQRAINEAAEGDTLVLRKGVYRLKESLRIEGKKDLVILGEGARLSGGVRIPRWRLHRARGYAKGVKKLNLGRYELGPIVPKGDPSLTGVSWSEFYADGVPMHLSEWPDKGPIPLDSVIVPGRGRVRPKTGDGFGVISFRGM